jgi:hypothetical protein
MISKSRLLLALASAIFAVAAFAAPQQAFADGSCSGNDEICKGSCITGCNPLDPNDCITTCHRTKTEPE